MALLVKDVEEKDYVQVPNKTAKAVEAKETDSPISLEALGLLVNLWSYDITKWEIHKTELYKRFAKNKKTSVSNSWDELVQANYIIEFKYRSGKKWEYVYLYRIRPYSEQEKEVKMLECVELAGVSSTSDFQHLKMGSSKCTVQNVHISNTISKQDSINKKQIKPKLKEKIIDDEEKEPFEINNSVFKQFVKEFENNYPNLFDNDMFNSIYEQMHYQELAVIYVHEAIVQARYMQKRIDSGELELGDYATYFVRGIKLKRPSEATARDKQTILEAEKFYKAKREQKEKERQTERPPFYNWLEN